MTTDNYYKNQKIVSYDSNKTWLEEYNSQLFFCKISTNEEFSNQIKMRELLKNKKIVINNKTYNINCPNIYSFNNEVIKMEYIDGINLEILMRKKETHSFGVEILNKLIRFFIDNKIYWVDFAPRNILISNNSIMIVDFEKGIMDAEENLMNYLRNHVYEEYNLFLFSNERILNNEEVFETQEIKKIFVDSIKSLRYRSIAKLLGYEKEINYQDYLDILRLIIEVEEPYINAGEYVFPGVLLDKLIYENINNNPIDLYSKEILKLSKDNNKSKNYS